MLEEVHKAAKPHSLEEVDFLVPVWFRVELSVQAFVSLDWSFFGPRPCNLIQGWGHGEQTGDC